MSGSRIRYAYRMTHIANVENILQVGIVSANSALANPNYVPIGDMTAIDTRKHKTLSDGSQIGDYIPFYLGPRTPMLYVIQNGYNNVPKRNVEEIVYCVIEISDIIRDNIKCVFTDGHVLNRITKTYSGELLGQIDNYVRYEDVYAMNWTDSPDAKRKKEAELLLKNDLPLQYIKYFLVYNENAKKRLIEIGLEEERIKIPQKINLFYF